MLKRSKIKSKTMLIEILDSIVDRKSISMVHYDNTNVIEKEITFEQAYKLVQDNILIIANMGMDNLSDSKQESLLIELKPNKFKGDDFPSEFYQLEYIVTPTI